MHFALALTRVKVSTHAVQLVELRQVEHSLGHI